MHSTHIVLSSLLGILLVSSTVVGAPIVKGSSTGVSGAPTSADSQHARQVSTINAPHVRFGMPVAAAQGRLAYNGAPIDPRDNDNAIHAHGIGLSGTNMFPGSEVVARGVVDKVSGLLDSRDVSTVSVPGSSDPSSTSSQHPTHELPLTPPINLPGRIGLAGGKVRTRDLAFNNDAIDVRDLGPMSTISLIDVITRSVIEEFRRRETSLPATESTHMARGTHMSREDEEACRHEGNTPEVVDAETGYARCTSDPFPRRGVLQLIGRREHGRQRRRAL